MEPLDQKPSDQRRAPPEDPRRDIIGHAHPTGSQEAGPLLGEPCAVGSHSGSYAGGEYDQQKK